MKKDDLQFYPTPPELARRVWKKFKDKHFVKVLEPSAGEGALAEACPNNDSMYGRKSVMPDCCEIDISKHGILREKGFNVVGIDFLKFGGGACYSHILLNPPFSEGAKHVLKAWDILWDGEIVAIVNAETVRNPFSSERKMLVDLIERFGEVEFIEGAFSVEEADRKTDIDIALVWLEKQADVKDEIVGTVLEDLKEDSMTESGLAGDYRVGAEVALPASVIENSVIAFKAAVRTAREAVFAEAKSNYYAALLGETMAVRNGDTGGTRKDTSIDFVKRELSKRYEELKDRAWANVLRSADVRSKLSSKAQKALEKEFEKISKLEFTVQNIYGFLCGIVDSQGQIQLDMACEVFDLITRYHSDNTVFFKGWKSNDRHRTCGMRIKTSRFILPYHKSDYWSSSLSWESMQTLTDIDKVFAMLDGKLRPEFGLVDLFSSSIKELRAGERMSSSYFDVRYYPGIGTIHFFAKDKKIVDRLNKTVGRVRQWIPPTDDLVNEAFWLQYDKAEKFDKEVRSEISNKSSGRFWEHPLNRYDSSNAVERDVAQAAIDEAITAVLDRHGICVDFQIESHQSEPVQNKRITLVPATENPQAADDHAQREMFDMLVMS